MNLSVGISVYDKIEELKILVSILRKFKIVKFIFVATTSDDDKIQRTIKKMDIDELITIPIPLEDSNKILRHKTMTARVTQSQKELMFMAKEYKSDFYMHTHSDGWPLNEDKIFTIIDKMNKNNIDMAYRGTGLGYRYFPGCPVGELDDHFYFLSVNSIKKYPLLQMNYKDMPYENINIHGYLALLVLSNVGLKNSWHYDNGLKWKTWDGLNVDISYGTPLKPSVYNENLFLLHVHRESFIGYGKQLQAYYLEKYLDEKCKTQYIKDFIKENSDDNIIQTLINKEKELDKKLKVRLISPKNFNRDLEYKNKIANMSFEKILKNILYFSFKSIQPNIYKKLKYVRKFNKDLTSEYPDKLQCMRKYDNR